jgi:hypothetical protein
LEANLEIWAVLENGDRLKVAEFAIKHRRVWTAYRTRFRPLMVTSLGRSETTQLMSFLSQHPQVVVHQAHPHELRIARYWMHMLKVLSEPANELQSSNRDRFQQELSFVGHNPFHGQYLASQGRLMKWLGSDYVERLAGFVTESIDDFYEVVALDQGQDQAIYFAESGLPDHISELAWELYPDGREVFLVRDPRDILCSIQKGEDGAAKVSLLAAQAASLADAWKQKGDRAIVVRYEDLVHDPMRALAEIARYAELDWAPKLLAGIIERGSIESLGSNNNRNGVDPAASVGRWRKDLSADLKKLAAIAFESFLKQFGYSEPVATKRAEPKLGRAG